MPDLEAAVQSVAGITGQLAPEVRTLVDGLSADRVAFREALREMSGFVATASLTLDRVGGQMERLVRQTERVDGQIERLAQQVAENNRRIAENNEVIRRLLDILSRGRQNGDSPPSS